MAVLVLATDGGPPAQTATWWLASWARRGDVVHVITVRMRFSDAMFTEMVESYVPLSDSVLEEMERSSTAAANKVVKDACAILSASGLACETAVLEGRPAEEIVRYVRAHAVDLLVMGTRGHGPIVGWAIGSVSLAVLAHAPCPVLIVPPCQR